MLPSFGIETIGPELAEQYLAKNTKNRPQKKLSQARYARDMAAGNWRVTGEAIKFDNAGNLLDGQNRLHAIIASGATIQTAVVRGLDPDTQGLMDTCTPRSGADQLHLNGFTNGKDLQAICNTHKAWSDRAFVNCMSALNTVGRLTNAEVLDYAQANPDLAEACKFAAGFKAHLRLPVGALGVAYDELVQIDADQAIEFFDRIRDLRTMGAGDPVAALIKRVAMERDNKRRIEVGLGIYLLFRTWNAWRSGERLTKFQLGSTERGWVTIPEPK